MPWKASDAEGHTKAADTPDKQKQWAAVANAALAKCLADDGEQEKCDAAAIKQANAAMSEQEPPDVCICPECEHEQEKERGVPCRAVKCPECGAKMVAKVGERLKDMETTAAEFVGGLEDFLSKIRGSFNKAFQPKQAPVEVTTSDYMWVRDIFASHPEIGDSVVVENGGILYAVPYSVNEDGVIEFVPRNEWEQVVQTYVKVKQSEEMEHAELGESANGHVIALTEAEGASIVPLYLDVAVIEPGPGNKHDNHYYPREVVERDAGIFTGIKMYETDHRRDEKSTRTWVSTVKEMHGFTESGAPIAQVAVHDQSFAERLLALQKADLLEKMECSILAGGVARKGKVDGKKYNVVEAITSAESVDWVTRAGAGGRALALSESGGTMDEEKVEIEEQEEPENVTLSEDEPEEPETPAPVEPLAAEKVQEALDKTKLPDASKARLAEVEYTSETVLDGAIQAETSYVKELTGSGKPFAQGQAEQPGPMTEEQYEEKMKGIWAKHGLEFVEVEK